LTAALMIPWEMTRRNPTIDIRMVASRQFGACFLVMLATGAILLATTQFLPKLVQEDFGYTATWAGVLNSPGGMLTMAMLFVAGSLVGKIQPKYLIAVGAVIIALSMYALINVYGDLGFWYMARCRMLFGVGFPLIFVSITSAAYDGIPPDKTGQASALINAALTTLELKFSVHTGLARRILACDAPLMGATSASPYGRPGNGPIMVHAICVALRDLTTQYARLLLRGQSRLNALVRRPMGPTTLAWSHPG